MIDVSAAGVIGKLLSWSKDHDYAGHSKHDALNSRFLNALTLNTRILRLVAIQAVMRSPVNMRPFFGVPRLRNPKGIGLFAHAYLDLAEGLGNTPVHGLSRESCLEEARRLLAWLVHNSSPWAPASRDMMNHFPAPECCGERATNNNGFLLAGVGWGYHYPWQDAGFFQPRHFPNRVVSSWIGFAFVRAYEATGDRRYLGVARDVVSFLLRNPKVLFESKDQLCLSYVPVPDIVMAVMDVSALAASLASQVAHHLGAAGEDTGTISRDARRLMNFVVDKQTDYGAWYYTWPSKDSHITHDNYHTGIILDCLADFMKYSGDHSFVDTYCSGLEFYEKNLFLDSGAPKWMHDKVFPSDIHGAAAGILAFSRAASYFSSDIPAPDREAAGNFIRMAERILGWTIDSLYDPKGFFYYRKGRLLTRRLNLMRWCNAWMARALARLLCSSGR